MFSIAAAVLAFCLVHALVAVAVHYSAVSCAKVLGGRFSWFDVEPIADRWWKSAVVRAVSLVSASAVVVSVLFLGHLVRGEVALTNRVEVLPGAAADAGLESGDRITRVSGVAVANAASAPPRRRAASKGQGPWLWQGGLLISGL